MEFANDFKRRQMIKYLTLIIPILLMSCGQKQYQDPIVAGVVQDFLSDAAAHGMQGLQANVEIDFGDAVAKCGGVPNTVGCCSNVGTSGGTITLLKAYWDECTLSEQKALLYHELGHCVLNRQHNPAYGPFKNLVGTIISLPVSIMNPYVLNDAQFDSGGEDYYNELLNELFSHK